MSLPVPPEGNAPPTSVEVPQFALPLRYIVGVGLFIFSILLILLMRPVLTTLLFAFVIAFILYIPVRVIARRTPLSFAASVIAVYAVIVLICAMLLFTLVPALISGVNTLVDQLQVANEDVTEWLEAYEPGDAIVTILGQQVDLDPIVQMVEPFFLGSLSDLTAEQTADEAENVVEPGESAVQMPTFAAMARSLMDVLGALASFVVSFASIIATLAVALFISFLALLDLGNGTGIANSIDPRYRREVRILLSRLDQIWLGFFKSQVLIALILGVLAYIQFIIFGVPGALPLAIFNGFFSVIPTVGGMISIIPLVIVTLLLGSTRFPEMDHVTFMLLMVIIQSVYSQLIYNVVSPPLVGKSVKLPVIVVIVGVLIGMTIGGILAAFLVVPVISTIKLMYTYLIAKVSLQDPFPDEAIPVPVGFFSQIVSENPESID